jgi:hypothetical protein
VDDKDEDRFAEETISINLENFEDGIAFSSGVAPDPKTVIEIQRMGTIERGNP